MPTFPPSSAGKTTLLERPPARQRPILLTRRGALGGLAGLVLGMTGLAGYAFGIEPRYRLRVTDYAPRLPLWPDDMPLTVAFVTDIHAGEPHMSLERIAEIVDVTNGLGCDLVLLGGDYVTSSRLLLRAYPAREWAPIVAGLKAPLGVYSILGNHDWWHGTLPHTPPDDARGVVAALTEVGVPVLENEAVSLRTPGGRPFWLLGLGDQIAYPLGHRRYRGVDDLPGTLVQVTDDSPAILLAHEPDIFAKQPSDRVALTLSGHTHGGQIRMFGFSPVVPSEFGNRFAYGHVVEDDRHLIVSGGLGTSIVPVRFGVPPEIVRISLGGAPLRGTA
jgi:predicted MPP superfamily phosphohydrolase